MLKKLLAIIRDANTCLEFSSRWIMLWSFLWVEVVRAVFSTEEIENKAVSAQDTKADRAISRAITSSVVSSTPK